jgi:hypothetical protein
MKKILNIVFLLLGMSYYAQAEPPLKNRQVIDSVLAQLNKRVPNADCIIILSRIVKSENNIAQIISLACIQAGAYKEDVKSVMQLFLTYDGVIIDHDDTKKPKILMP